MKSKLIVNTRAVAHKDRFTALVSSDTAEIVELNLTYSDSLNISIESKEKISQANWLVFTSPNGVLSFFQDLNFVVLPHQKVAAVGAGTESYLGQFGVTASIVSDEGNSKDLVRLLLDEVVSSEKILHLRGEHGSNYIVETLSGKGFLVEQLPIYKVIEKNLSEQDQKNLEYVSSQLNLQSKMPSKMPSRITSRTVFLLVSSMLGFKIISKLFSKEELLKVRFLVVGEKLNQIIIDSGYESYLAKNNRIEDLAEYINSIV